MMKDVSSFLISSLSDPIVPTGDHVDIAQQSETVRGEARSSVRGCP
jgi:hypothetical protein